MDFAKSVKGLDSDTVQNAAIAGKAMAEMAATLPNTGGVAGFFAGENDMDIFGEQLARWVPSFIKLLLGGTPSCLTAGFSPASIHFLFSKWSFLSLL